MLKPVAFEATALHSPRAAHIGAQMTYANTIAERRVYDCFIRRATCSRHA